MKGLCHRTRILLFISLSLLFGVALTLLLKVFEVLEPLIEKFNKIWDNKKGVSWVTMILSIIIFSFLFSLLFLCYYRVTKNQEELIENNRRTQSMLGYAPGIKEKTINELETQLQRQYYTISKEPKNQIVQEKITSIEEKLELLKNGNERNLFS